MAVTWTQHGEAVTVRTMHPPVACTVMIRLGETVLAAVARATEALQAYLEEQVQCSAGA